MPPTTLGLGLDLGSVAFGGSDGGGGVPATAILDHLSAAILDENSQPILAEAA